MSSEADTPELNPYASPQIDEEVQVPGAAEPTREERIRREFLNREASIRSIGTLCFLGAVIFSFYTVVFVVFAASESAGGGLIGIVVCVGLAMLHGWCGRGLRNFNSRVRPWAIVISVLWILYLGVGTVLGILSIIWLTGKKGRYVLSEEYRQIVDATPHIRYKTSRVTWIVLGILILIILSFILAPIASWIWAQ